MPLFMRHDHLFVSMPAVPSPLARQRALGLDVQDFYESIGVQVALLREAYRSIPSTYSQKTKLGEVDARLAVLQKQIVTERAKLREVLDSITETKGHLACSRHAAHAFMDVLNRALPHMLGIIEKTTPLLRASTDFIRIHDETCPAHERAAGELWLDAAQPAFIAMDYEMNALKTGARMARQGTAR